MAVQLLEDWLLKEQEKIVTTYRELNQAPLKEPGLIFIGDSIVEYFPFMNYYKVPNTWSIEEYEAIRRISFVNI